MEKINYTKSSKEIELLKSEIEKKANIKVRTPSDFYYLTGLISGATNDMLSATTLKRLWGYIEGGKTVRNSTLNILAKFLGYDNLVDFLNSNNRPKQELVRTCDLKGDERLELSWRPCKRIVIKYRNCKFVVEEQENTIFHIGDEFSCPLFVLHEPMFIEKFTHNKEEPKTCVLGGDGLTSIIFLDKQR